MAEVYYGLREAARVVGVSRAVLRQAIYSGQLIASRQTTGRREWIIPRTDLLRWMARDYRYWNIPDHDQAEAQARLVGQLRAIFSEEPGK